MNTWEALGLYYQLGDGLTWNVQSRIVVFRSKKSAQAFKNAYPLFTVRYNP
jgi:hypothetical protein